jgi:hypothetical protein
MPVGGRRCAGEQSDQSEQRDDCETWRNHDGGQCQREGEGEIDRQQASATCVRGRRAAVVAAVVN